MLLQRDLGALLQEKVPDRNSKAVAFLRFQKRVCRAIGLHNADPEVSLSALFKATSHQLWHLLGASHLDWANHSGY
jgi:hypothetical protein